MNKKIIVICIVSLIVLTTFSQKQNYIRGGGNIDLSFPNAGFGIGGNIDLRYNIFDNLNAGIKIGSMYSASNVSYNDTEYTGGLTASMINYYLLHSDYYFNYGRSIFAPFVGAGLGLYKISNLKLQVDETPQFSELLNLSRNNKFGALIRTGIEISWFRIALEYNLIPRSDLMGLDDNLIPPAIKVVGTTPNSYFTITTGFYIGGGKWGK